MAILHDVEVTISAKGKRLKEYDDDAEEPSPSNTATKYIEALTGASFQVHYTIKPALQFKSSGIVIRIEIDGEHMDSDVLIRGQHLKETNRVCYSSTFNGARRFQNQGWTLQAFIFAEIKTSEDIFAAPDSDLKNIVSKLGVIRVEAYHVKLKNSQAPSTIYANPRKLDALPEKALKGQALSHKASLGPLQRIHPLLMTKVDYIGSPFAVFNFKYRSRKSLQGTLIIPRTPSPVPLEQRPINELTHEEALELLRRRSFQVKPEVEPAVSVKREHDNLDPERNDDEEYVALLASARAQKVARIQKPVDVIDLLDD